MPPTSPSPAGTVLAAFLPTVPVVDVAAWLGFPDAKAAVPFLQSQGGVGARGEIDVRASRQRLPAVG